MYYKLFRSHQTYIWSPNITEVDRYSSDPLVAWIKDHPGVTSMKVDLLNVRDCSKYIKYGFEYS